VTRRDFVKGFGSFAFVVAVGGFNLGSFAYIPVSGGYLQVDRTECAGCRSCMAACSLVHEGKVNLSLARIQINQDELAPFPNDMGMYQCRQCTDAPCVDACPTGALHVDEDHANVRTIDRSVCVGCGACLEACPFTPKNLQFHPRTGGGVVAAGTVNLKENVMQKCDLCANAPFWNRQSGPGVDKGQACVAVCPAQAIRFVTDVSAGYDADFYEKKPNVRGWGTVKA
jgi:protein NrfC